VILWLVDELFPGKRRFDSHWHHCEPGGIWKCVLQKLLPCSEKIPTLPLDTSEPQTEMLKVFIFIFSTVVSVIVKEHKCMCVFQCGEECQCDTAVVEVR